jgi:PiT family inorganic phosphate transporter
VAAWVVVISQSIVLFLFASTSLEHTLLAAGLPTIPLIPVSSSQAVVGAVIGIGLMHGKKGAKLIRWRVLGGIASGWVSTPVISFLICFVMLFFLQNVFNQQVYKPVYFNLTTPVLERLAANGIASPALEKLKDQRIESGIAFRHTIRQQGDFNDSEIAIIVAKAEIYRLDIAAEKVRLLDRDYLSEAQIAAVEKLTGQQYEYRWQVEDALAAQTDEWKKKEASALNKLYNKKLSQQLHYLESTFEATAEQQGATRRLH